MQITKGRQTAIDAIMTPDSTTIRHHPSSRSSATVPTTLLTIKDGMRKCATGLVPAGTESIR